MIAFIIALLASLGFMSAPAMDSDPSPALAGYAAPAGAYANALPALPDAGPTSLAPDSAPAADAGARTPVVAPAPDCTPWLVPETDEGYARSQELQAAGWAGDPSDGMEALYPPGC